MTETMTSAAHVASDRPARYGKQLASHFSHKIEAHWDEDAATGTALFPIDDTGDSVQCDMTAGEGRLDLVLTGPADSIGRIEGASPVTSSALANRGSSRSSLSARTAKPPPSSMRKSSASSRWPWCEQTRGNVEKRITEAGACQAPKAQRGHIARILSCEPYTWNCRIAQRGQINPF